ncbi:hypothetical protein [Curtobacterium citreum]|uniref:hypothetical protein n=1 Tax=Curtobacterium citreum TaxID=2036 RepID=UPI00073734CC|nr:hypothetical protein [Curtobacterium citreum]KTR20122.1 hypothetical protein NS330_06845 [Curtobacterium citreum]
MTGPGEPSGQQDRGYYGAGWQQPAPSAPAPQGGYIPPLPPARGPRDRAEADPRRAFAPGASLANTTGALIAVVSIVVVEFVSGVFGLLGTSLVVHPFTTSGTGASLIGSFVSGVFASPFPFYAGTFLSLAFLTPIARRSPLPTVLLRAVLAGAAGTVALALVGVFTGLYAATRTGSGVRLVTDVLTGPLQNGVPFTLMLLGTATVAWLWTGRPRGGRRGASVVGRPGTVRPADAVPPATVQPQPQPQQQPHQPQAPQPPVQQQPGVPASDGRWAPPAPR